MDDRYRPEDKGVANAIAVVIDILPRVFRFLWEVSPGLLALSCVLLFIMALIPAAIVWMTKVIIDLVVVSAGTEIVWSVILIPVAVIFALWVLQAACESASSMVQEYLSERAWNHANQKLQRKAAELDIAFFESPKFYDQLHHATRELFRIMSLSYSSLSLVQQSFALIFMVSLLSILHPVAILVLLLCTLPRILVESKFARMRFDLQSELVRNDRMGFYLQSLLTSRDNVTEIRIFGLADYFVNRFLHFRRIYLIALRKLLLKLLKMNIGLNILSMGGVASVWGYGVYQAVLQKITLGDLSLVFQSAQQSRSLLTGVISSSSNVYQSALFATRFFDFLDLDPQSVEGALEPPRSEHPPAIPTPLTQGVEFRNVSFSYPGSDEPILKDVSFVVPAGKKLAIVGQNGAGKTTIIKLLTRLYDPSGGAVLADGVDLREYDLDSVRAAMSVTFQDFVRYDITASDNIGLGRVTEIDNQTEIENAAKKGGAHEVLTKLPQSYDTILGKQFDEGVDLSGGEWQQVAISRAFMSDAQVLILDEPTSALDALKEQQLYERFAELTKDKTVVFISHRFSTVRMADVIVVIEDGQAVEVGDHDSLMTKAGAYARMFSAQAERYR